MSLGVLAASFCWPFFHFVRKHLSENIWMLLPKKTVAVVLLVNVRDFNLFSIFQLTTKLLINFCLSLDFSALIQNTLQPFSYKYLFVLIDKWTFYVCLVINWILNTITRLMKTFVYTLNMGVGRESQHLYGSSYV